MSERTPMTAPPSTRKVALTVHEHGPIRRIELSCIHGSNPIPATVNVFRIGNALIDAGFLYVINELIEYLKTDPPEQVILTHHHEDHIAALNSILETFGDMPILAPRPLLPFIQQVDEISTYRQLFWGQAQACKAVEAYDAGDAFDVGPATLESIETPGHCPFHCGFVLRTKPTTFVMSGDLYYRRKPLSIWHESSAPDAIESCRKLAALDDEIYLLPNHLPPVEDGSSALEAQAEWIEMEAAKVQEAAESLGTADPARVAEHLYGPPTAFERMSNGEITKASFVRSVLDPVKTLPAKPIVFPDNSG